jgi:hypothetical protein
MSDREHHCPFLNRADHRCSDFFSIEQIQHAFEHCFHAYRACAVYQELLVERQARRGYAAASAPGQFVWTTACAAPVVTPGAGCDARDTRPTATTRFVQVRVPTIATGPRVCAAAAAAAASAASGADGYSKPAA